MRLLAYMQRSIKPYDNEVINGKLILNHNKYFDIVCIFSWIIKLKQQHG